MQSIVALLAVLFGVAFAHQIDISSDDLNQKNRDISATEYLKRIFKNSRMHYDGLMDLSSPDGIDDLIAKLPALGLFEASDIARQVDLKQIIRDDGRTLFTLCLPSDRAVQRWRHELPRELKPEALKELVKAWIIPDVVRDSSIANNDKFSSLNGAKLRFNVYRNDEKIVTVNGAIITKDVDITSNIIIKVVDKVLYPLPIGNVLKTLVDDVGIFSQFIYLFHRAGLSGLLSVDPITVLVPFNMAFDNLPSGIIDDLKTNVTKLHDLLKYHVISDVKYSASLSSGQSIGAWQGEGISVNISGGKIRLNQERDDSAANVIEADIPTTNGVIHVIDHVLIP